MGPGLLRKNLGCDQNQSRLSSDEPRPAGVQIVEDVLGLVFVNGANRVVDDGDAAAAAEQAFDGKADAEQLPRGAGVKLILNLARRHRQFIKVGEETGEKIARDHF